MLNFKILCLLPGLLAFVSAGKPPAYCCTGTGKPGILIPRNQCDNTLRSSKKAAFKLEVEPIICCKEEINKLGLKQLELQLDICGKCNITNDGKVGRWEVDIHSRPWMALLFYKLPHRSMEIPKCGGSLITDRFVLTAAHCLYIPSFDLIRVRLGEHHWAKSKYRKNRIYEERYKEYGIRQKIIHERYQRYTNQDDIALLELDKPVGFVDHIMPICLPLNNIEDNIIPMELYFSGWGSNFSNHSMNTILREGRLSLSNITNCWDWIKNGQLLEIYPFGRTQICTTQTNTYTWSGDSGSPLYWPGKFCNSDKIIQYGIISYGLNNSANNSDTNTNIIQYIPWITRKIGADQTNLPKIQRQKCKLNYT